MNSMACHWYDMATDTNETKNPMPSESAYGGFSTLSNGDLVVTGGYKEGKKYSPLDKQRFAQF